MLTCFHTVENIIFCRPSSLQLVLYRKLLSSRVVQSCLTHSNGNNESSPHLVCIGALKKLCNSPSLIYDAASNDSNQVGSYLYRYSCNDIGILIGHVV